VDICSAPWASAYIYGIYADGITSGYGNGIYGPNDFVTREQMATFLIRALKTVPGDGYCGGTYPFSDVASNRWSCKYIKRLAELGLTSGYGDGRFGPEDTVTREQMATFLIRALEPVPADGYCGATYPFSDVASERWSCKYIKRLAELGITSGYGDGRFGPEDEVTRAQMAIFLAKAFLGMENPDPVQQDYCPPVGTILINGGEFVTETAAVTLNLSASDQSGVVEMCVSNNPASCTSWEPYVTEKTWTLDLGDGLKTVYVWFKDGSGLINDMPFSDSINLVTIQVDTLPPTGSVQINGGFPSTQTASVTLNLSASDQSGVVGMCVSNTASCSSWEAYVTPKGWALSRGNGTKMVYVWFMDGVGNTNWTPYSGIIDLVEEEKLGDAP